MKRPSFLKPEDVIAIVSPAFAVEKHKVEEAVQVIEGWHLMVMLGKHVFNSEGPFSGNERERLDDIQMMISDPAVKAILFSRGGYGCIQIVDKIDFSPLETYPKWLVGFSDITVLHSWMNEVVKCPTIHGEMLLNYSNPLKEAVTFTTLHDALFGTAKPIVWKGRTIRPKKAEGVLVGGNLSLIYSMIGTKAEIDTRGRILFIEDVGEQFYHVDRMLNSMRLAGKFDNLAALVVGSFSKMLDTTTPWGKTIEEIVMSVTRGYDFPVFLNFPAGHVPDNRAFYLGCNTVVTPGEENEFRQIIDL